MNTRLPKKSIYQKKDLIGISKKCDWFIHCNQIIKQNEIPHTIFLSNYQGKVTIPFFYHKVLPLLDIPITVIIASEDYTFPQGTGDTRANFYNSNQELVFNLINHPKIKKIWLENLDTLHPKLSPLPLGILKYHSYHLITDLINYQQITFNNRKNNVLCCHRIHQCKTDQFNKRKIISQLCLNHWSKYVTYYPSLSYPNMLNQMKQSRFVLCVNGGGIDPSPKCWEAILCGAIPIIQHSTLDKAYSQLPVIFINKWSENTLTEDKLNQWFEEKRKYYENEDLRKQVLKRLSLDYWWNQILRVKPSKIN